MWACISLYCGILIKLINLVVFVLYLKVKAISYVLGTELSQLVFPMFQCVARSAEQQPQGPHEGRAGRAAPAAAVGRARGQHRPPSSARRGQPGRAAAAALCGGLPAEVSPRRALRGLGRAWAAPVQREGAGGSKELINPLEHHLCRQCIEDARIMGNQLKSTRDLEKG